MERARSGILGALAGILFTTMGLIDTRSGLEVSGGNEATPAVVVVGAVVGVLLGATVLRRFPVLLAGLVLGLALGIWLRDNAGPTPVQPPWVFVLLFGLPVAGAVGGYLWHRRRAKSRSDR